MIHRSAWVVLLGGIAGGLWGDSGFWTTASALITQGKTDQAEVMARAALASNPDDPDALVIEGTVVLYKNLEPRRDDSIFHPNSDPAAPPVPTLTAAGADAVAALWKRVPDLDPTRSYLWGDLAQLTYRAGSVTQAVEYAKRVLTVHEPDSDALRSAASVFTLTLDPDRAAQALSKIPGNRTSLLYQGLSAWRKGQTGWRDPLKAFVADPGTEASGKALATFLLGPDMRDTDLGFQAAVKVEGGIPALVVRQKYVDRYPTRFLSRLGLGRTLNEFGNYPGALAQYAEIDRLGLASSADERQTVLFQQAWANQASGHYDEASRLWTMVMESRDFYLRSAAAWFLGASAAAQGRSDEASHWWAQVADEPARSKYAFWAAAELKKLQ